VINKKDVTIVVAPEKGKDLSPRDVARRIMALVEKNSSAFLRVNAKAGERAAQIEGLQGEIAGLEQTLDGLKVQLERAQEVRASAAAKAPKVVAAPAAEIDSRAPVKVAEPEPVSAPVAIKPSEDPRAKENPILSSAAAALALDNDWPDYQRIRGEAVAAANAESAAKLAEVYRLEAIMQAHPEQMRSIRPYAPKATASDEVAAAYAAWKPLIRGAFAPLDAPSVLTWAAHRDRAEALGIPVAGGNTAETVARVKADGAAKFKAESDARMAAHREKLAKANPPAPRTIDAMHEERNTLQAEWDAKSANVKRQAKIDRTMNEGGGGYSKSDAMSESLAREYLPRLTALDDEIFRAEWTPEVTAQRRAAWNAEMGELVKRKVGMTSKVMGEVQDRVGFTHTDLKRALAMKPAEPAAPVATEPPIPAPVPAPFVASAAPIPVDLPTNVAPPDYKTRPMDMTDEQLADELRAVRNARTSTPLGFLTSEERGHHEMVDRETKLRAAGEKNKAIAPPKNGLFSFRASARGGPLKVGEEVHDPTIGGHGGGPNGHRYVVVKSALRTDENGERAYFAQVKAAPSTAIRPVTPKSSVPTAPEPVAEPVASAPAAAEPPAADLLGDAPQAFQTQPVALTPEGAEMLNPYKVKPMTPDKLEWLNKIASIVARDRGITHEKAMSVVTNDSEDSINSRALWLAYAEGMPPYKVASDQYAADIIPADLPKISPEGAESKVKTAKGTEVLTGYSVIEADRLITSHDPSTGDANPAFPAELQPRDRGRDASIAWVRKTANDLDPDLLGKSRRADSGAPIIGPDGVVESGNGRTMAVVLAYQSGKADDYRAWLEDEAAYFGLKPEKVKAMRRPVLVRIRTSKVDRAAFAIEANQSDTLAMTATEKAKSDARRMDDGMIALMTENGDLAAAENVPFLSAFLRTLGEAEAAQYSTTDGKPTSTLIARVQAAIFAKAYNDDRLLELTADVAKPEIANIVKALNHAAPEFIQAAAMDPEAAGAATGKLTDAVEKSLNQRAVDALLGASNVIRQAKDAGQSVEEFVGQAGLFGDIDPDVAAMAVFIAKNNRSAKRMGEAFKAMATFIKGEIQRRQTGDMFGDSEPVAFKDIVAAANRELERMYGPGVETIGLFDRPAAAEPVEPAATAVEPAAAADDPVAQADPSPEPDFDPVAAVNAAYTFDKATDDFKAQLADTLDLTDYSEFATAKGIDQAVKAAGGTVSWSLVVGAILDSVADMSDGWEADDPSEYEGVFDSVSGGEPQGVIRKGARILGRAVFGGDGKAMIYVGKAGADRVMINGQRAMWGEEPQALVSALFVMAGEVVMVGKTDPLKNYPADKLEEMLSSSQELVARLEQDLSRSVGDAIKSATLSKSIAGKKRDMKKYQKRLDDLKASPAVEAAMAEPKGTKVTKKQSAETIEPTISPAMAPAAVAAQPDDAESAKKQEFIANYIRRNGPKPGMRQRGGSDAASLAAKAEAAWLANNTPENLMIKALREKGGKPWGIGDGPITRVYFDTPLPSGPWFNGYLDIKANSWRNASGTEAASGVVSELLAKIGMPAPVAAPIVSDPDAAFLRSVIDKTAPDMLDPAMADKIEAVMTRRAGDAEIDNLAGKAIDAYMAAAMDATAGLK
jgi:hypothetical protein